MAKFMMGEVVGVEPITARLGAGTGSSNNSRLPNSARSSSW